MTTVLIVDDEALAIQAIRRSINWKNLDVDRVLDAANGVEAQRILRRELVQVLVCDLEMPRMSGIELLEWMKTSCPDTEAVILTCHESFPMAQKAMELGCVEYVLKPIAPAELTASIRHALNLWKTQESMRGTRRAYENGRSLRRDQYLQDVLEKTSYPRRNLFSTVHKSMIWSWMSVRRCRWYGYWCRCLLHCRRASRSCSDTACAILPRSFGIKPVPAGPLCSAEVDRVFCSSALEWNLLRLRISGKNWVWPARRC